MRNTTSHKPRLHPIAWLNQPGFSDCGGDNIPSDPLPDSLDLSVGIEFGIFGPGDTGNDFDDGYLHKQEGAV